MKPIFTFFLALLFVVGGNAQNRDNLKGPKAKNYRPSKTEAKAQKPILSYDRKSSLKGPSAKNYKPWKEKSRVKKSPVDMKRSKNLMGPKAKNYKPGKKSN